MALHLAPGSIRINAVHPANVNTRLLFLVSDEARYITGQQIRVDAGSLLKFPGGPAA